MRQCFSLAVALFLLVAPLTASAAPPAVPATWDAATAYIIFEKTPEGITPLSYQTIQLASPLKSLDTTAYLNDLAQKSPDHSLLAVSLTTAEGNLVYQNTVTLPTILRGEFHGKDGGEIDGYQFPLEDVTFPVRVPYIPGTTLTLKDASLTRLASFDLASLAEKTPAALDAGIQYTVTPVSYTGSPANRVDMVILGDGYTAAQQATFNTHVATVVANFFGIPPLQAYQNYYNIYSVFAASTQSGADHPPYKVGCVAGDPTCCGDTYMRDYDPLQGQMPPTIYESAYCTWNIHRLLYPKDYTAVYTAAAQVPNYDEILIIVNDPTYGGGGGSFAVFSMHTAAVQVAQHEYGHSFALLGDEYTYGTPSTCDDTNASTYDDCPANVTNQTTRALIKWAPWIQGTTPIPTPGDAGWGGFVGLFKGAVYDPNNHYRPGDWCIMRALGYPFCQVPSQIYVLRLYQGGWGTPFEGISLIEPGTTSPAPTGIQLFYPATQTFQATILSPTVISPTAISWWVNGVEQVGATSSSFIYTSSLSQLGTVTIKLRANDASLYVHPSMAGTDLITEYTWTINVAYPIYMPMMTSP